MKAFTFLVIAAFAIGIQLASWSPSGETKGARLVFFHNYWFELKQDVDDGYTRVAAFTYTEGRSIEVRCFGNPVWDLWRFDIRYTIVVPLLSRLSKDFKDKDGITLDIAVGSDVAAAKGASRTFKARSDFGGGGLWFLADVDRAMVETIANAKEKIFAVPLMKGEKIDDDVPFGTERVEKYVSPVLDACKPKRPGPIETG